MRIHDFLKIYALILLAHIAAQMVADDFSFLFFTKLLIPLSVLLYGIYHNPNKLTNALLSSAFAFFLFGNVLMMIKPTYDPCRFDTPIFSYSAAFIFLAILPLTRVHWSPLNIGLGVLTAVSNGALSFLYISKGLQSSTVIFYMFLISFVAMSFFTFLFDSSNRNRYFVIGGMLSISVSNHILGFCTFREKMPILVPLAMLFYGGSLILFLIGYMDFRNLPTHNDSQDDGNTNS